ncbi:hypothetical protein C8A01DRAFT_47538 [Parachaetomium inaequale]|uniref:Zn(2)-C6 fungal-type domain-containing protein n=1 Tax=Parachaetomium inaequale TaxID=2588326 RepID=A0AAN6PDH3_9PEZI|nr:hypothetical protein C8A01DRAFT_47538 [Parachaetomium inaequale]
MPRHNLTANACLVCRRKRTKCDGGTPCRRCISRGEECVYEDKRLRTKDHLRSEITRLRTEQRHGQALLRALANNDPERWDMVLDRMRAGDPPETIAEWILAQPSTSLSGAFSRSPRASADDENPSHGLDATATPGAAICSALSQPGGSLAGPSRGHPAATPPARRLSFDPPPSMFPPGIYTPPVDPPRRQHSPPPESSVDPIARTWTNITDDKSLVQRLLAKFFASSLPYLSMVSQRHFMRDFREGNPRYCSEALVNAVLGMACKVATPTSQLVSRVSFGDAFIGEAKGLLATEQDYTNLPCIQALGVLAVAELAQGNEEAANDLGRESIRACIRLLLQTQQQQHSHDDDFRTVRALAYCGGFSLTRLFGLLAGDLEPKTGPLFMRIHPDSSAVGDEGPQARIERGVSLQMEFFTQLQYCPPLARFIFEVTEAAHSFLSYNHSEVMTASDLDRAFNKCLGYHRHFAQSGALNMDYGPDVVLALIWYNFCLLSLLEPFAKDPASLEGGLPPSLSRDATPHTVCRQASEAMISLTSTYQNRYSLACFPPFLPYMVFAAALHQLSLAVSPLYESHQEGQLVRSPEPLSSEPIYDSTYSISSTKSSIPRPRTSFHATRPTTGGPEPLSPTLVMQIPRSAGRRDSVLSTSPTCFSNDDQSRWPSVCSSVSNTTTSDVDGAPSLEHPDTQSGFLPNPTSQPLDLVAIGSLQLTSMGARHPAAAKAAHLLRTSGLGAGLGLYSIPSPVTGRDSTPSGTTPGHHLYTALGAASQSSL